MTNKIPMCSHAIPLKECRYCDKSRAELSQEEPVSEATFQAEKIHDDAWQQGYEAGVRDEATKTKNPSSRYLLGYEAGKRDTIEAARKDPTIIMKREDFQV